MRANPPSHRTSKYIQKFVGLVHKSSIERLLELVRAALALVGPVAERERELVGEERALGAPAVGVARGVERRGGIDARGRAGLADGPLPELGG